MDGTADHSLNQLNLNIMNIELMMLMLQVLDDPTSVRIIVETKYPNLESESDNAYFMIDRSNGGVIHAVTGEVIDEAEVYDYWQVSDSIGQTRKFNSNVELIEFIGGIEDIITRMWMESF